MVGCWETKGRGGICLHRFALKLNTLLKNMTINQCAPDCGLGRPGEAQTSGLLFKWENQQYSLGGGVVGSPSFFDLAVLMERSARSQSRKTCQSNVTRWGLG